MSPYERNDEGRKTRRLMDEGRVACKCCEVARSSARACEYARVCGEYLDAFRTYSPAGRHPLGFAKDLSAYTPEYFEKPYSKY